MKLYIWGKAPNPRRVLIYLEEKGIDVPCPVEWSMLIANQSSAMDRIGYPCIHGAGTTHLDSFAHVFFDGKMWNGYPVAGVVTMDHGAGKNSILTMKSGIVTRGVLYDIPKLKGVDYLELGTRIFPEDLEAWEKKTGVKAGGSLNHNQTLLRSRAIS